MKWSWSMGRWRLFLDSLDSDGGHLFILGCVMAGGLVAQRYGIMEGRELLTGAFGALLMKIKDAGSNHDRTLPKGGGW